MKNLIDEIKELEVYECEYERSPLGIVWLKDCYLKRDLDKLLNQYNIITAPKQIKLSEIVKRLNCEVDRYNEYINLYEPYADFNEENLLIKDNKINEIHVGLNEETKWLYTLWIAETEIIDDLEEE